MCIPSTCMHDIFKLHLSCIIIPLQHARNGKCILAVRLLTTLHARAHMHVQLHTTFLGLIRAVLTTLQLSLTPAWRKVPIAVAYNQHWLTPLLSFLMINMMSPHMFALWLAISNSVTYLAKGPEAGWGLFTAWWSSGRHLRTWL